MIRMRCQKKKRVNKVIYGIGIDLIEIDRIKTMLERQKRFPEKVLSQDELDKFHSFSHPQRQAEFLAGRFACKEAFSKALGTGCLLYTSPSPRDLSTTRMPSSA